eukprot:scaffold1791_cov161-Pinguiococcus_pyrenoidosus.AAC.3
MHRCADEEDEEDEEDDHSENDPAFTFETLLREKRALQSARHAGSPCGGALLRLGRERGGGGCRLRRRRAKWHSAEHAYGSNGSPANRSRPRESSVGRWSSDNR